MWSLCIDLRIKKAELFYLQLFILCKNKNLQCFSQEELQAYCHRNTCGIVRHVLRCVHTVVRAGRYHIPNKVFSFVYVCMCVCLRVKQTTK